MGAWIEIIKARERLKQQGVAPLVGAWIEICRICQRLCRIQVAPLVGAWIEIVVNLLSSCIPLSLPLWERGLKYIGSDTDSPYSRRSPCGSVD